MIMQEVDDYLARAKRWKEELTVLRGFLIESGLEENFKWKTPCYSYLGNNVVILNQLKNYCALGFFKGTLMKDLESVMDKPGENSQAVRMIKFTSIDQVKEAEMTILAYVEEAIQIEKSGKKVQFKAKNELVYPVELEDKMNDDSEFEEAFEALTAGRKRGYILHFTQAKQASTRIARIEKCTSKILDGKGFHDCTCGMSKRMPTCDGSHKFL